MYMNKIGNTLPTENGCYSLMGVLSFFVVQMGDTMCIVVGSEQYSEVCVKETADSERLLCLPRLRNNESNIL